MLAFFYFTCLLSLESFLDDEIRGGWYVNVPIVNPQHLLMEATNVKSNVRGTSRGQCFAGIQVVKELNTTQRMKSLWKWW